MPEGARSGRERSSAMLLAVLGALAMLAVFAADLWRRYDEMEERAFRETRNLSVVLAAHAARTFQSADQALRTVAAEDEPAAFDASARVLLANLPFLRSLLVVNADGAIVAGVSPTAQRGMSLAASTPFIAFRDAQVEPSALFIGAPQRAVTSAGELLIPLGRGRFDEAGRLTAVVIAAVEPRHFTQLFDALDKGEFSAVTMLERRGVIAARSPRHEEFAGRSLAGGELVHRLIPAADSGSLRYKGVLIGRDLLLSYAAVAGTPYVINVAIDGAALFAPWYELLFVYMLAWLAIALTAAILAHFAARRAEQARALAETVRVREIFDGLPAAMALLDTEGTVIETNELPLRVARTSRADVLGRPVWTTSWFRDLPESVARLRAAVSCAADGRDWRGDVPAVTPQGVNLLVEVTLHPLKEAGGRTGRIVMSGFDVTEQRRLADRSRETERMEAMGRFASGIAHDFNNLLGAIRGFAGFLYDDTPAGSASQDHARRILTLARRGGDLVAQILAFSRMDDFKSGRICLRDTVVKSVALLPPPGPGAAPVNLAPAEGPLWIDGSAAQIARVIANLCANARDAMSDRESTVEITLRRVPPNERDDASDLAFGTLRPDREYIRIDVRDFGPGIDPAVRTKMFEPFFTTKATGRGTGLGLAVVHGIVLSHGGACAVRSAAGEGTVVSVYLPLAEPGLAKAA